MADHEDTVRRLADAFARGDTEEAVGYLDPEVELLPIRAQLEGGSYRGHEGYRAVVADFEQDWEGLRLELEELYDAGDKIVTVGRVRARGRASGVDLDIPAALLYSFRGDRVIRVETFADPADAFRAAGIED